MKMKEKIYRMMIGVISPITFREGDAQRRSSPREATRGAHAGKAKSEAGASGIPDARTWLAKRRLRRTKEVRKENRLLTCWQLLQVYMTQS